MNTNTAQFAILAIIEALEKRTGIQVDYLSLDKIDVTKLTSKRKEYCRTVTIRLAEKRRSSRPMGREGKQP